jgi:hypothetical protein
MGRLTMGRKCDGVWWQVEHGPLQKYTMRLMERKNYWCQSLMVCKNMQACENVKLHALGVLWGNTTCP